MSADLPIDATLRNLTGSASKRAEYIRRVLVNLETQGTARFETKVRIGIAGKGISPHYKFESLVPYSVYSVDGAKVADGEARETFVIFNGMSHKRMTAFEAADIRDEHWSSRPMSFEDVRTSLGQVRQEMKAS